MWIERACLRLLRLLVSNSRSATRAGAQRRKLLLHPHRVMAVAFILNIHIESAPARQQLQRPDQLMFEEDADTSERRFIALLVAAVFVVLLGIRFYANHLNQEKALAAQRLSEAAAESATQNPRRVLHLEAITHVYECERNGQRVLTDRPCGTGVPIRFIDEPTRADPTK